MPKGKRPDYQAATVVEVVGLDKGRWTNIGVAYKNEKSNTISILLDATPVNGKIILSVPKPQDGE